MADHDAAPPEWDDIPDTRDLVQPTAAEVPLWTLANTIAIRSMRRDFASAKLWFKRMCMAFVGGSVTVAGAIVGVAVERGEERESARHVAVEVSELGERVTYLERKNDGRARRGRESEE